PGIGRKTPCKASPHTSACHSVNGTAMANHRVTLVLPAKSVRERPSQSPTRIVPWMIKRVAIMGIPVGHKSGNKRFSPIQEAANSTAIEKRRRALEYSSEDFAGATISCQR
ncbi:MAG: hypothetical protein ACLP5H_24255, partial [Desulfomonilaceae bacterium]